MSKLKIVVKSAVTFETQTRYERMFFYNPVYRKKAIVTARIQMLGNVMFSVCLSVHRRVTPGLLVPGPFTRKVPRSGLQPGLTPIRPVTRRYPPGQDSPSPQAKQGAHPPQRGYTEGGMPLAVTLDLLF